MFRQNVPSALRAFIRPVVPGEISETEPGNWMPVLRLAVKQAA